VPAWSRTAARQETHDERSTALAPKNARLDGTPVGQMPYGSARTAPSSPHGGRPDGPPRGIRAPWGAAPPTPSRNDSEEPTRLTPPKPRQRAPTCTNANQAERLVQLCPRRDPDDQPQHLEPSGVGSCGSFGAVAHRWYSCERGICVFLRTAWDETRPKRVRGLRPHFPDSPGGPDGSLPSGLC
jgi:hypothetical protein